MAIYRSDTHIERQPTSLYLMDLTAADAECTGPNCGSRCVGLFCNAPCIINCLKNPDPDWWDPVDPADPWPPSAPYEPEDPKCTTTSASSCYTECLAANPTSTCSSSCSISYGCSVTDTSTLGTYTLAPYGYWTADSFDRASDDNPAFTSSVYAELDAELNDWFPTTVTVTVTPISTTTLPDTTVTVTPTANCAFWDASLYYLFEIYNINGWAETDDGAALRDEESGCGALTGWDWTDAGGGNYAYVYFNLPTILTASCVERAILSAGGPKIECEGMGVAGLKRRRAMEEQQASFKAPSVTPSYTYASGVAEAAHTYIPQHWNTTTMAAAPLDDWEGHGVVKLWMTPTPDNETTGYTMYTMAYPTAIPTGPGNSTQWNGTIPSSSSNGAHRNETL
jgi:hypothetical protein